MKLGTFQEQSLDLEKPIRTSDAGDVNSKTTTIHYCSTKSLLCSRVRIQLSSVEMTGLERVEIDVVLQQATS